MGLWQTGRQVIQSLAELVGILVEVFGEVRMDPGYMGSWTAKLEELQAETSRGERSELRVQEATVLPLPGQLHLLP